jgi:ribosomal protein S18 acetylase RimI-like enzyme
VIREAAAEDAPAVARVWVESWRWAYGDLLPADVLDRFCDPDRRERTVRGGIEEDTVYLVAERDGRIVGFACDRGSVEMAGVDAEVTSLYVGPDAAGRGVGGELLAACARRFLERGARSMGVQTLAGNRIGRGFYAKRGGVERPGSEWHGLAGVEYVWNEAATRRLAGA